MGGIPAIAVFAGEKMSGVSDADEASGTHTHFPCTGISNGVGLNCCDCGRVRSASDAVQASVVH